MKTELIARVNDGPDQEIRMSIIVFGERYDALIEVFRSTPTGPIRIQAVRISAKNLKYAVAFLQKARRWNPANER